LNLDEVLCVQYLITAQDEVRTCATQFNALKRVQFRCISEPCMQLAQLRTVPEHDVAKMLWISGPVAMLKLCSVYPCFLCAHIPDMLFARVQRGSFTLESAAGVYLSERQAEARCLMRLLAEVAQQLVFTPDAGRCVAHGVVWGGHLQAAPLVGLLTQNRARALADAY
jgi:hypothetical protein